MLKTKGDKKMTRKVKRMVKSLGSSAPLEFPSAEVMALIMWAISYSIFHNRLHFAVTITLSTVIAILIFLLFKRYIKSDKCKQKEVNIDIINKFNLKKKKNVEVSLTSIYRFDANLFNYAVKTLIDLQLLKFYAKLSDDGKKIVVYIKDDKGRTISGHTFYKVTEFEEIFRPKKEKIA